MNREEEHRINKWSHEYYSRESTTANSASDWHAPVNPEDIEMVRHAEMRLNDIRDTYRMMKEDPPVMMRLQSMRNDMINERGTVTMGEIIEEEVKEEPEGEEFLFDPKELDI